MSTTAVYILSGGSGHGCVVLDALRAGGIQPVGYSELQEMEDFGKGLQYLGTDAEAHGAFPNAVLALGVGDNALRQRVAQAWPGNLAEPIVHARAYVADGAELGRGTIVVAGATVQPGAHLGDGVIVNTNASVDHDCDVGNYAHIAVGATLAGEVRIGEGALIGAGVVVLPGRHVGAWATVGAGAVVARDIPGHETWFGNPARHYNPDQATRD